MNSSTGKLQNNFSVHDNMWKLFYAGWIDLLAKKKGNYLLLTCWVGLNGVELAMPWVPWKIPDEIPPPGERFKGGRAVTTVNLWEVLLGYTGSYLLSNLTPSVGGKSGPGGRGGGIYDWQYRWEGLQPLYNQNESVSLSRFLHAVAAFACLVHRANLLKVRETVSFWETDANIANR